MTPEEAKDFIDKKVKENDLVVFMKGNMDFPMCGFSGQVVSILKSLGYDFKDVNVLEDDSVRQAIKDYSNWLTIPQVFVKGEFIGGCDIVSEMAQKGELQKLLKEKIGDPA